MFARRLLDRIGYLLLAFVLSACQTAKISPTPTNTRTGLPATATATATATSTSPAPTQTSRPSAMPASPTSTLEPTATPFDSAALLVGSWTELPSMPTRRSEMPAVVLDGKIYVAGGFGNPGSDRGALVYPAAQSRAVEVFDPQTGAWESRADLPAGRHHLQVAALEGRLYVLGGSGLCPEACGFQNTFWEYDPQRDAWQELPPMPVELSAGAAASLDGRLYLIGGVPGDGQSVLRYDPATAEWQSVAALNQPREHTAAVVYNGKVYVFGGRWREDLTSMEVYDPALDTWTVGPPMRQARAGHAAALVGDLIYVLGGETILSTEERVVESVEIFDPANKRWLGGFDLPAGLHGVGAAGLEGVLYVIGGSSQAGVVANRGEVWAYRP